MAVRPVLGQTGCKRRPASRRPPAQAHRSTAGAGKRAVAPHPGESPSRTRAPAVTGRTVPTSSFPLDRRLIHRTDERAVFSRVFDREDPATQVRVGGDDRHRRRHAAASQPLDRPRVVIITVIDRAHTSSGTATSPCATPTALYRPASRATSRSRSLSARASPNRGAEARRWLPAAAATCASPSEAPVREC